MKTTLVVAAALALSASFVYADDQEDFEKLMKETAQTAGRIRKTLETKSVDGVSKDAKRLEEIFTTVHGYYAKNQVEDATKFATASIEAAKNLGAAAEGGDAEKTAAAAKAFQGTCAGCHGAHREKLADGKYKMK